MPQTGILLFRKYFIRTIISLSLLVICSSLACHASNYQYADSAYIYHERSYDILKYTLAIDLYSCYDPPFPKSFKAREVITFRIDTSIRMIRLDASNGSLLIDSIAMAGVSFKHASDTLTIRLNRIYQKGEVVSIRICYRHKDTADHAFYAGDGYAFFDLPAEGARKVFPCRDIPSCKAKWELTARVPVAVRLGSNGSLADSVISGDTLYYHWISHDPMSTYLMTLTSAKDYKIDIKYWHKPWHPMDSIPVRFYYQGSEHPAPVENIIIPLADFYSRMFGDYPFEKIGFATLNWLFQWGGMENQTMINLQKDGWHEILAAHEFSHQWFGDLITCGTWADIWLNESFATYCEALWLEHTKGYSAYKDHLATRATGYLNNNPGFPIYNQGWLYHTPPVHLLYNAAVIYNKGACTLHQLRYILGDSLFFRALHAYMTDTNFIYKNAVTADFISKVNRVSGKDYSWFFNEWVYSANHPVYKNTYEITKTARNKWTVSYEIKQTQSNAPFFRMPVEILIGFNDQSDTLIKIDNTVNPQLFQGSFTKHPISCSFDPYENILLKEASTEMGKLESKTK
jgi:aminopeptidase N